MIAREAVRAVAAFALYLVLYPVWGFAGGHEVYEKFVIKIASVVMLATQHFPVYETLQNFEIIYLDFLPILVLSYFLVSTRLGWGTRLRRFGILLTVILVLHAIGIVLETKGDAAEQLQKTEGLVILLPWELVAVDVFKYLLVDFGLNIGPFVVMLLGIAWNAGIGLSRDTGPVAPERRAAGTPAGKATRAGPAGRWWSPARVAILALVAVIAGAATWRGLRESDPRHVQAHALLGHLFLRDRQPAKAEEQYGIALEHGCTDAQVFYNLARIQVQTGRTGDAIRLLRRGLDAVEDTDWRRRILEERVRLTSGG